MLNELLQARFGCPVCGRILYPFKIRGYWCPYCGADLELDSEEPQKVEINLKNRLTMRDEHEIPTYIGEYSFKNSAYPEDLNLTAITQILEKLCQYEEILEENDVTTG